MYYVGRSYKPLRILGWIDWFYLYFKFWRLPKFNSAYQFPRGFYYKDLVSLLCKLVLAYCILINLFSILWLWFTSNFCKLIWRDHVSRLSNIKPRYLELMCIEIEMLLKKIWRGVIFRSVDVIMALQDLLSFSFTRHTWNQLRLRMSLKCDCKWDEAMK